MKILLKLFLLAFVALILSCSGGEDRKISYIEKGDRLYEEGNYEKAQLEYKNALQIDPKDATAHFKLAQTAENLKAWRTAVQHYLAVLQLDESHVEARIKLAQIYLLGGVRNQAKEMIDEAISLNGNNADALAVRGGIALQNEEVDEAQKDANAALTLDEKNNLARSLQVAIYMRKNEVDKAIELVKQNIQQQPDNVTQNLLLADIYIRNGRAEEAILPINSLIESYPENLTFRIQKVNLLSALKRPEDAKNEINQALNDFPDNSQVKLLLVRFLAQYESKDVAESKLKEFVELNSDELKLKLALGDWYASDKKLDLAKEQYLLIIEEDQHLEALEARKRLAKLEFKAGNEENALAHLDEILTRNPRDPDGLLLRGAYSLSKNDAASAIADFRSILKDKPNDISVLRLLAYSYLQNNQPNLAKEAIQQAVKFDEDNEELQLIYAQLLGNQGERGLARDVLDEVIANNDGNEQALKVMFDLQVAEKDWDGAISTAEKIQQMQPDSALPEYLQGLLFDAKGSKIEAEKKYLAALEKQPNAVEPLTALVKHYVNGGEFVKAHSLLDDTIENNPNNVVAYNLKAEMYVKQGELNEAEKYFSKAINLQPNWWVPYRGYAAMLYSQKKVSEAIDKYAEGISNGADIERLGVDRALILENNKQLSEAKQQYQDILVKKEDSTIAKNNLAMLLVGNNANQTDLELAGKLVEEFSTSNSPAYLDTFGWVQYKLGNNDDAITSLEKAVALAPKAPELRYHLGMAYAANNENEKAIEELQTAVDANRNFRGIEQAKRTLDELKS